jgi:hypothetical protein
MSTRSERECKRYAEDPQYRERRLASNNAWREAHKTEINARRRLHWATDPDYRRRQTAARRRGRQREYDLRRLYGITVADYERLLARRKSRCAICRKTSRRRLQVDHCHRSGAIRRLLCRRCNLGLGHFDDDVRLLRCAAAYLGAPLTPPARPEEARQPQRQAQSAPPDAGGDPWSTPHDATVLTPSAARQSGSAPAGFWH